MARTSTPDLIAAIVDEGSWRSWDAPVASPDADADYAAELAGARASSGTDESITTGSARVGEQSVAVVAGDFTFLAGSLGTAAAARLVAAFERATSLGLPVLGLPVSGGIRMQEGTPAFLQMTGIAAAVRRHLDAGIPYLVYLRHPTTGGVFASWGSLGDITFAEPKALVGFLGPRVYEGLAGEPFPADVQTAEALAAAGVIDGVATAEAWRDIVVAALTDWRARPEAVAAGTTWEEAGSGSGARLRTASAEPVDPWEAVTATRAQDRPGLAELVAAADGVVTLSGTGAGEVAGATALVVCRIDSVGCVVVGFDRSRQQVGARVGPADLRVARRGMALAQRWGLPLVTVVDTQGGELSPAAEHGALAGEIARCLSDMSHLQAPTLSVLLGGGAGGVALALLPADRVVAAADAWVTPLPPEGAAVIRHRDPARAADLARAQRITAADLAAVGAVDRIVPSPDRELTTLMPVIGEELTRLSAGPVDLGARATRWATVGL